METTIDPNLLHLARTQSQVAQGLTYQLQVDDIIIEVEHLLRGDVYDELKEQWINHIEFKHMNELGIKRISSVLKTYLNRNEFLTTYEEDRIFKKCILCVDNLSELFILEGDNYELKEEEYDLVLWQIIIPNVESAIRRATGAMTLDAHSKMQFVQETIDRSKQQQTEEMQEKTRWRLFGGG